MTSFKPAVDQDEVVALLGRHLPPPIRDVRPVVGGNVARIFACTAGGGDGEGFIIRFTSRHAARFAKEAHIAQALAPTGVPISSILHIGEHGDLRFAISRLAPGTMYDALPPAVGHAMLPTLIETLDAIHAVDIGDTTGFGTFDDRGTGMFPSWRHSLASIREEEPGDQGSYGNWHSLFKTTFLDRATFDAVYARMAEFLPFCPEDRCLVHGDYGFGNVLVDDGHITAVLDWGDAKYGDRLYDVAWLAFWAADPDSPDFAAIFADHSTRKGAILPNYTERIACYQHAIALDAFRYSAKANDEWGYNWILKRLRVLHP